MATTSSGTPRALTTTPIPTKIRTRTRALAVHGDTEDAGASTGGGDGCQLERPEVLRPIEKLDLFGNIIYFAKGQTLPKHVTA